MTYPSWPEELPRPERNTWGVTPQDSRMKRRSDAGPVGYRGRFSSASDGVTLSVLLDRNERAIFDNFFKHTVSRGSRLWWMPDPTSDGWPLLDGSGQQIMTSGGIPILIARRWLVTFDDQLPRESIQGVGFRKTFSVAVMP